LREEASDGSAYAGIELPIRQNGLTLGRIVLLPSAQSVAEIFSPGARERAIAMAAQLATPVATALTNGDISRFEWLPAR
jgi:hypothetical protein